MVIELLVTPGADELPPSPPPLLPPLLPPPQPAVASASTAPPASRRMCDVRMVPPWCPGLCPRNLIGGESSRHAGGTGSFPDRYLRRRGPTRATRRRTEPT